MPASCRLLKTVYDNNKRLSRGEEPLAVPGTQSQKDLDHGNGQFPPASQGEEAFADKNAEEQMGSQQEQKAEPPQESRHGGRAALEFTVVVQLGAYYNQKTVYGWDWDKIRKAQSPVYNFCVKHKFRKHKNRLTGDGNAPSGKKFRFHVNVPLVLIVVQNACREV